MAEPTVMQYADFGTAVSGIMDAFLVDVGIEPDHVIEVIQIAAATYGIELGLTHD